MAARKNQIKIPTSPSHHLGIDMSYDKNAKTITLGGWYDSMVGMQVPPLSLEDFKQAFPDLIKDIIKGEK